MPFKTNDRYDSLVANELYLYKNYLVFVFDVISNTTPK